MYKTWQSNLDGVKIYNYTVLLSYPNASDPNYIAIVSADGVESDLSQKVEKILSPDQNDSTVVNPFNAYSPSGVIVVSHLEKHFIIDDKYMVKKKWWLSN